jgi:hypothetical protein
VCAFLLPALTGIVTNRVARVCASQRLLLPWSFQLLLAFLPPFLARAVALVAQFEAPNPAISFPNGRRG